MAGVITASEPSWISPFTGVNPRQFHKTVTALRREGADAVRRGRPWGLPLEDRVLLVVAYWRTNLTMRQLALLFGISKSAADRIIDQIGPLLALKPRQRFASDTAAAIAAAACSACSNVWDGMTCRRSLAEPLGTTGYSTTMAATPRGRRLRCVRRATRSLPMTAGTIGPGLPRQASPWSARASRSADAAPSVCRRSRAPSGDIAIRNAALSAGAWAGGRVSMGFRARRRRVVVCLARCAAWRA